MISNLLNGFATAMDPVLIITMMLAILGGLMIGAIPGLSATMGVAILVPLTFKLPAEQGLFILVAIFISAVQGGSVPAVLINTPGTPASAVTTLDGHPLAKQGKAGRAIGIAQVSSFFGLLISWVLLVTMAPLIAKIALKFGPAEYTAIAFFGLSMVVSLSSESVVKGIISAIVGLIVASIGMDPIEGIPRLTFGSSYLLGGVSYVPALIGLFAISEVLTDVEHIHEPAEKVDSEKNAKLPTSDDLKTIGPTVFRSGLVGTLLGSLPGVGADVSSFICYGIEKRVNHDKIKLGEGNIKGIAASETGNNAVCGGALIPMLALGIPGDAVTSIILGSLIIWGIIPGSALFSRNGELVYTLFAGFLVASIFTLIMGLLLVKPFTKVLSIPQHILLPAVGLLCLVGSYAINNSVYDVIVAVIFGILGYFMRKANYPTNPVVLAMILGPMLESNARRALLLSEGSPMIFITHPISLIFIVVSVISIVLSFKAAKSVK